MADEDDIESFWEGTRLPPMPPEERRRQAIETGLRLAQEDIRREGDTIIQPDFQELERRAILQRRLGEAGQRMLVRDPEELRPSLEQILTAAEAGPGAEAQIEAFARYPLQIQIPSSTIPFTEIGVVNQPMSSVGQAIQQERRVAELLSRVRYEEGTGDPIPPDEDPGLFALDESSTEAHLTTLHQALAALGFPAIIELSQDTGTLYLTFPPNLNVDIHLGQFVPAVASQRPGDTTISIER